MKWFAVYREFDGELLSLGTVIADPLGRGLAKKLLSEPPARGLLWNPRTLEFDPVPPRPPEVDRVEEFLDALPSGFNGARKGQIRSELRLLLGKYRFRSANVARDLPS